MARTVSHKKKKFIFSNFSLEIFVAEVIADTVAPKLGSLFDTHKKKSVDPS